MGKAGALEDELKAAIGARIRELLKNNKESIAEILTEYNIPRSTFTSYLTGQCFPPPQLIISLAEKYNVSIDWIMKGQESLLPKDGLESDILTMTREAASLGVASEGMEYMAYIVDRARDREKAKAHVLRLKVSKVVVRDTIGKRMRSARGDRNMSPEEMAGELGLTERALDDIEEGRTVPGAQVLTRLSSLLDDERWFNWIIEGE